MVFVCTVFYLNTFSQTKDTTNVVSLIVKFDKSKETKDGFFVNEYVVNISHEQAQKLNRRKIKITGKVSIVKGLNNQPKEYDEKGTEVFKQGRNEDTKYILEPIIEILD